MKKGFFTFSASMFVFLLLLLTAANEPHVTTIFMIGDSTMANKDTTGGKQERGWGMMLQECFDSRFVRIDNHAVNGLSSLSFINERRWARVVEKIRPGDYVIIQFGHNDEKPKPDRHTEPGSTFDANLARFVNETRERGGIPVLMNAVVRRNFFVEAPENDDDEKLRETTFKDGVKMVEGDSLIDTHGLYRVAPRQVAERLHVPFVDANRITHELEQRMGREGSKRLHMWFRPGEEPSVPNGRQDNTHYNIYGARTVARLLADALCEEVPVLKPYRTKSSMAAPLHAVSTAPFDNPDTIVVDAKGTGQFCTVGEAIEVCRAFMDYHKVIYVKNGIYKEKLIIPQWLQNIEICGESRDGTIITFDDHANVPRIETGLPMGTFRTYTLKIEGNGITLKNLTVQNNSARLGQAVALHTEGDCLVFINCRFIGHQDTIYTGMPQTRLYFEGCYICGTTDFIFGASTAWFEDCTIESLANSYITAASTPQHQPYGYIFNRCHLIAAEGVDKVYLGRPWRDYGYTLFMHCDMAGHIRPEGWHHWKKDREQTARYLEYDNRGSGADTQHRVSWCRQLTRKEAAKITLEKVLGKDFGAQCFKNCSSCSASSWNSLGLKPWPAPGMMWRRASL